MSNVSLINGHIDGADTCVICGRDIPEGSQVCVICGKTEPRDMVEVKHGYWKHTQEPLGCRDGDCECGEHLCDDEKYCSNCGQKIDWGK